MIDLNDLRHAISRALTLGRYTIELRPQNGQPVPASITLDLLERDDDLFDTDEPSRRQYGATITPEGDALVDPVTHEVSWPISFSAEPRKMDDIMPERVCTDDHGPAIPAQGENHYTDDGEKTVRVYEFALQDAINFPGDWTLAHAGIHHAPDIDAANRADWVHVYDRVTRERRTLKRPEPDAVLKGLLDVAADLRGGVAARAMTDPSISKDFPAGDPYSDPMPPVGPLTSTEGLKAGDVLRVVERAAGGPSIGRIVSVVKSDETDIWPSGYGNGWLANRFAFVARPGVWMPWEGGENPIPGLNCRVRRRSEKCGEQDLMPSSESNCWQHDYGEIDITAYMVVDPSPVSSDT